VGKELEPYSKWAIESSAVNGSLVGIATATLHQVHHAISNNIPNDIITHVIGEMFAGALGGALLFAGVACLRNWLRGR
jgi:hypothetical protein